MFYAYVLKSALSKTIFIKVIVTIFKTRLSQHNAGMTASIKPYLPFEIAYFEEFQTEQEAVSRERYFKSSAGRRYLKKRMAP